MRLFRLGETEIRCSPLLLAAVPLAFVFGREKLLAAAFVSLSVHEAAHAMLAHRLGQSVRSVELQPFGFIARLSCDEAPAADRAAIFAAGPLASLCMAAMSALLEDAAPFYAEAHLGFTEYNLLIAAVNLLPALPLDGGRLILAAFSRRGRRTALKALRIAGIAAGSAFIALFAWMLTFGALNPTFAVMGVFLIIAALREGPASPLCRTTGVRLMREGALAVHEIASSAQTPIHKALSMLPPGGYSVVTVVDEKLRRVAEIDEARLLEAAGVLGGSALLSEAVALYRGEML